MESRIGEIRQRLEDKIVKKRVIIGGDFNARTGDVGGIIGDAFVEENKRSQKIRL